MLNLIDTDFNLEVELRPEQFLQLINYLNRYCISPNCSINADPSLIALAAYGMQLHGKIRTFIRRYKSPVQRQRRYVVKIPAYIVRLLHKQMQLDEITPEERSILGVFDLCLASAGYRNF